MLVPLHMFMFPFSWDLDQFPEKEIGATIQSCIIVWCFFVRWIEVPETSARDDQVCRRTRNFLHILVFQCLQLADWLAYRFCVVYLSPIVSHHFLNFQQPWHPRQCVVYEKWGQTRGLRWLQRHLLHQAERLPEGLRALGLQSEDEKAKGWDIWDLIFPQFVPE